MPPALDVEQGGLSPEPTTSAEIDAIVSKIKDWLEYVLTETGRTPVLYTSKAAWDSILKMPLTSVFGIFPLWITNIINSAATPAELEKGLALGKQPLIPSEPPQMSAGFITWVFWQSRILPPGTVNGITSAVDYDLFNGESTFLKAFYGP